MVVELIQDRLMKRALTAIVIFLAAAAGSRPQQVGENKGPGGTQSFTLTVRSNLVIEAVR